MATSVRAAPCLRRCPSAPEHVRTTDAAAAGRPQRSVAPTGRTSCPPSPVARTPRIRVSLARGRHGHVADVTRMAERGGRSRARAAAPAPVVDGPCRGPGGAGALPQPRADLADLQRARPARGRGRTHPLLERVKFLAISASNLDEFFMKRIGGLKQQVGAGVQERTVDGRTPQQQIAECYAVVRELEAPRSARLRTRCSTELREHGIAARCRTTSSTPTSRRALREYYLRNIFPLVTPQAMDPAHPFPFVSNLSLNLLVTGHHPKDTEPLLARVKVPVGAASRASCGSATARRFVPLEDVMAHNLDLLLPGHGGRVVRAVPRHAQRQHRARRGRGRRPAGDDRVGAARAPLRADRAPRGGGRHGARSTAACSPPSSGSTSTPTSSRSTACWRCAT